MALQTCLALVLAFFVAPFQHVHTGHGSGPDHDHAGLIHSHFYLHHFSGISGYVDGHYGPRLVDSDDDDHADAYSLNTFTIELAAAPAPFIPSLGPVLLFVPTQTFQPVEVVEERGHDPPPIGRSIPRAPPA